MTRPPPKDKLGNVLGPENFDNELTGTLEEALSHMPPEFRERFLKQLEKDRAEFEKRKEAFAGRKKK